MNQFTGLPSRETKKSYEDMKFDELEADPIAGPVLRDMALKWFKDKDQEHWDKTYGGKTGQIVGGCPEIMELFKNTQAKLKELGK